MINTKKILATGALITALLASSVSNADENKFVDYNTNSGSSKEIVVDSPRTL